MVPVQKQESVHELAGPAPLTVLLPSPAATGQGFVCPAAKKRIQKLIKSNQELFTPVHDSSIPVLSGSGSTCSGSNCPGRFNCISMACTASMVSAAPT